MNKEIVVDGITYVPQSEANKEKAVSFKGLKYVIVRTYSAGVFAGYLKKKTGQNGILLNTRRLWYWDGAASLSQLAIDGVSKPENCKFPDEVEEIELDQIIEVIPATKKAQESIKSVSIWKI
jgi:hypothetical protein